MLKLEIEHLKDKQKEGITAEKTSFSGFLSYNESELDKKSLNADAVIYVLWFVNVQSAANYSMLCH